jgi:hypothetical protein
MPGVQLRGFFGVVGRMQIMDMGDMRMMGGLLVKSGSMMPRGFPMVLGSLVVMLGSFVMMHDGLHGHGDCLPDYWFAEY